MEVDVKVFAIRGSTSFGEGVGDENKVEEYNEVVIEGARRRGRR